MFLSEISVLRNYPLVCFAYYCNPIRSPGLLINPDLLPQGGAWSDTAGGQRRERRRGTGGCSGTRESSGWGRVAGGGGERVGAGCPPATGSLTTSATGDDPFPPQADRRERRSPPHRGRKPGRDDPPRTAGGDLDCGGSTPLWLSETPAPAPRARPPPTPLESRDPGRKTLRNALRNVSGEDGRPPSPVPRDIFLSRPRHRSVATLPCDRPHPSRRLPRGGSRQTSGGWWAPRAHPFPASPLDAALPRDRTMRPLRKKIRIDKKSGRTDGIEIISKIYQSIIAEGADF